MKKKTILLIGGILVASILLGGCFKKKIEIKNTERFEFGYSVGNYMYGDYLYKFQIKDDGKLMAYYKADGIPEEETLSKEITEEELHELEKILEKHEIYKWNGFNKSDKNVLDGHSFHLYYWTLEKENIDASGYMMYPKGYKEFKDDIITFYTTLFKEEIEKQKATREE